MVVEDSQASRCFTPCRALNCMHQLQIQLSLHPHHSTRRPRRQASGVDGEAGVKVPSYRIGIESEQDPGEHRRIARNHVLYQNQMAGSRGHPDPAAHTSPRRVHRAITAPECDARGPALHSNRLAETDILPGSLRCPGPPASSRLV